MSHSGRVLIASTLLVSCGGAASVGHTLNGSLAFDNVGYVVRSGVSMQYVYTPEVDRLYPCAGTGEDADIVTGAQVTVTDEKGTTLGVAPLEDDREQTEAAMPLSGEPPTPGEVVYHYCFYQFTVRNVSEATVFVVKVGQREIATYSRADLEARNWSVDLVVPPAPSGESLPPD